MKRKASSDIFVYEDSQPVFTTQERNLKITVIKGAEISNTQMNIWGSALKKIGIEISTAYSEDVSHIVAGSKCSELQVRYC